MDKAEEIYDTPADRGKGNITLSLNLENKLKLEIEKNEKIVEERKDLEFDLQQADQAMADILSRYKRLHV